MVEGHIPAMTIEEAVSDPARIRRQSLEIPDDFLCIACQFGRQQRQRHFPHLIRRLPGQDRAGAERAHAVVIEIMQFGIEAGEIVAEALAGRIRQKLVIVGDEVFALDLGMAGENRRAVMNAHIGNRHRQRRPDAAEKSGFPDQRPLGGRIARKLEDQTVIDIDGRRIPALRRELENGARQLRKDVGDKRAKITGVQLGHDSLPPHFPGSIPRKNLQCGPNSVSPVQPALAARQGGERCLNDYILV